MKKIGIAASVLLLLAIIQSTIFYFAILKVGFSDWIFFNACAPSSLTYLIGFVIYLAVKNKTFMYLGVLPMFFFGLSGLFVFSWSGMNIMTQIMHIIMLLNIIWLIILTFKEEQFKSATIGLLLSIFIFGIFIGFQQDYIRKHSEEFKHTLSINKI
jgi:hypothetical protein